MVSIDNDAVLDAHLLRALSNQSIENGSIHQTCLPQPEMTQKIIFF